MQTIVLKPDDAAMVLDVNNAAIPNVSLADLAELTDLITMSELTVRPEGRRHPAGLRADLPPGVSTAVPTTAVFSEHYDEFVYVDRIVVTESARNRGVGAELYRLVVATRDRTPDAAGDVRGEPRSAEPGQPPVPQAPGLRGGGHTGLKQITLDDIQRSLQRCTTAQFITHIYFYPSQNPENRSPIIWLGWR